MSPLNSIPAAVLFILYLLNYFDALKSFEKLYKVKRPIIIHAMNNHFKNTKK